MSDMEIWTKPLCGAPAIGQETERANANKAAGQDVEQETAQELLRTEGHDSFLISVGIILPAESNLIMLESNEAVVGDGHAMGVAGEIAEHMMRTTEGWLGVDDPVLAEEWTQEGAERFLVFERLERSGESEIWEIATAGIAWWTKPAGYNWNSGSGRRRKRCRKFSAGCRAVGSHWKSGRILPGSVDCSASWGMK